MYRAVLAQVEAGQVKAEHLRLAERDRVGVPLRTPRFRRGYVEEAQEGLGIGNALRQREPERAARHLRLATTSKRTERLRPKLGLVRASA